MQQQSEVIYKLLIKSDKVLDVDFLVLYMEKISQLEINSKDIELSSNKLKAIITFQQPVDVKVINEKLKKKDGFEKYNLRVEPVPAIRKVIVYHRPGLMEDELPLYLESSKHFPCGGDVASVELVMPGGGISIVDFGNSTVAERVANIKQHDCEELGTIKFELMTPLVNTEDLKLRAEQAAVSSANNVELSQQPTGNTNLPDERNQQTMMERSLSKASGAVTHPSLLCSKRGDLPSVQKSTRASEHQVLDVDRPFVSSSVEPWKETICGYAGGKLKELSLEVKPREKYWLIKKRYDALLANSDIVPCAGCEVLFDDRVQFVKIHGRDESAVKTQQDLINEIVLNEVFVETFALCGRASKNFMTWIQDILDSEKLEAVVYTVDNGLAVAAFDQNAALSAINRLRERSLTGKVRKREGGDKASSQKVIEKLYRFIAACEKEKSVIISKGDGCYEVFGKPRDVILAVDELEEK